MRIKNITKIRQISNKLPKLMIILVIISVVLGACTNATTVIPTATTLPPTDTPAPTDKSARLFELSPLWASPGTGCAMNYRTAVLLKVMILPDILLLLTPMAVTTKSLIATQLQVRILS